MALGFLYKMIGGCHSSPWGTQQTLRSRERKPRPWPLARDCEGFACCLFDLERQHWGMEADRPLQRHGTRLLRNPPNIDGWRALWLCIR